MAASHAKNKPASSATSRNGIAKHRRGRSGSPGVVKVTSSNAARLRSSAAHLSASSPSSSASVWSHASSSNGRPRRRGRMDNFAESLAAPKGKKEEEASDLTGDYGNVALLLALYFLQGIPMGISMTLDLTLLEGAKLSYEQQGIYSSVGWPYSLKMLWAPIVDALYVRRFGRRKTWLVPTQFLIGLILFFSAGYVPELVETASVWPLTGLFFTLYTLAATQDIAVDGWALEILAKRNLGWASTCNAVGLTAGYTCAFTGFLALKTFGVCELPVFMRVCGVCFLVVTALVAVFKREIAYNKRAEAGGQNDDEDDEVDLESEEKKRARGGRRGKKAAEVVPTDPSSMSVKQSYVLLKKVLTLPAVKALLVILLTRQVAFAPVDALTTRKLMEKGLTKEALASLMALLTPVSIVLPGIIAKFTANRPLRLFGLAFAPRLVLALASCVLVYYTPNIKAASGEGAETTFPAWFFFAVYLLSILGTIVSTVQFVSIMAFFAKVCDPLVGGSYMTALNTATNLGSKWPTTLAYFMVGKLTWQTCEEEDPTKCVVALDGYYILSLAGIALGVAWIHHFRKRFDEIERMDESVWKL